MEAGFLEQRQRRQAGDHRDWIAGQRARLLLETLPQPREIPEHMFKIVRGVPRRARVGPQLQVFLDGQLHEGATPIGHMRNPQANDILGRKTADCRAVQHNVAAGAA